MAERHHRQCQKGRGYFDRNVLRGSKWPFSVIGLGLNISQDDFVPELPHATSLKKESGHTYPLPELLAALRENVFREVVAAPGADVVMARYNSYLLQKSNEQVLIKNGCEERFIIQEVQARRTTGSKE